MAPASDPDAPADRDAALPHRPAHLFPDYRGILLFFAVAVVVLLLIPPTRAWLYTTFLLPMVADVLGRGSITIHGVTADASYPWSIQVLFAALLVMALVLLRAELLSRQARGHRWARRVRLDGAFFLSLTPFLMLGPVLAALEAGLLFRVPYAFLFVAPPLYLTIAGLAFVSLLFGLWMEEGGPKHSISRFVTALFVFLSVDLFWISVLEGTTRRLSWWAAPVAVAIAFLVWYGVTLGNRLLSHRRALFALGTFHVAFFGTYLAIWILEGPWAAHGWSYSGIAAVRIIPNHDPILALHLLLVPVSLAVAFYTLGQFLHRYATWTEPWVHGLNIALIFAQTLDAWAAVVVYHDPFDALPFPPGRAVVLGGAAGPLLGLFGGWGYLALKTIGALVAVWVLDRPFRRLPPAWQEAGNLGRAALVALGLEPGLRVTIRLATGL